MKRSLACLPLLFILLACERPRSKTEPVPAPAPIREPARPAAGTATAFPAGSLIIPNSAAYQTACGAISAYGLIYNVLRANRWLALNGYSKIAVHYTYKDSKTSPNRCVPTNRNVPPSYTGGPVPVPYNDAIWNDGCDFRVVDNTVTPVRQISNATGSLSVTDVNIATIATTSRTDVYPTYPTVTIQHTLLANSNVFDVGYLGGPFVIAASDAPTFLRLLEGSLIAKDVFGAAIDFAPFRTNPNSCTLGTDHYVRVHRAAVAFTAESNRRFTNAPPRLGLLATDSSGLTKKISNGILQGYLTNAGLNFAGEQGCPPGSRNAANLAICPNGDSPGQIFDVFDFADLVNNLHTLKDTSGVPLYAAVWAPHWESTATGTVAASASERTATANLGAWLDGQNGLMAECASIEALEGGYQSGAKEEVALQPLLTCVNDGTGKCSAAATNWGLDKNVNNTPSGLVKNCSDPTLATGASCAFYSFPGNPFVQTGDYLWNASNGHVQNYLPLAATSSIFRPGVSPLVSGVRTLDKTKLGSPSAARAMIVADYAAYGKKLGDPFKGEIHYVAGHNLTDSIAGNLAILQTLLQLGNVDTSVEPTTLEVSRASPVVAMVGNVQAIVQGSLEAKTPSPIKTTINFDADAAVFEFPYSKGHMRAFATSDVGTVATRFSDVGAIFDAATGIPTPNYTGCATFTAACRTVFTTTATGRLPALVQVTSGNRASLGPFIGSDLGAAAQDTLLSRVLAGFRLDTGAYIPKLGGVDRSTVAVIAASTVAGTARPTMAYFGATDGMLHAVCASVAGPCDQLGRELWAYIPRVELGKLRYNTATVDGSPRVVDAFGDFYGTGRRSFRTILTFQTGNGNAALAHEAPAVYALDVTDPASPRVLWEYRRANAAALQAYELGQGLTLAMGPTTIAGARKFLTVAQTNNGGTAGAANVITAIDTETGSRIWQFGYTYPNPPRLAADAPVPATGIPGGAVGVDRDGTGLLTDIVAGDLYGNLWKLDPVTGTSRIPGNRPLFSFLTDYHPIGVPPTIYSDGAQQFAIVATGGFADLTGASWGNTNQYAVAVRLETPAASAPLNELSGPPNVPFKINFGAGERAFAQAVVLGTQIFVTTDTADVNASNYGNAANTGRVYTLDLGTGLVGGVATVQSGGAALANDGVRLFNSSGASLQEVARADGSIGTRVENDPSVTAKVIRSLWLNVE